MDSVGKASYLINTSMAASQLRRAGMIKKKKRAIAADTAQMYEKCSTFMAAYEYNRFKRSGKVDLSQSVQSESQSHSMPSWHTNISSGLLQGVETGNPNVLS